MSGLDILRSFAESREHDAVLIRDGVSYGEIRETLRVIAKLEGELETAQRERDEIRARSIRRKATLAAERERREAAEWVLKEIRIRLHAAGRRPEECWEMSEIDGHLAQFGRHKD